jgi:hypothetical protein
MYLFSGGQTVEKGTYWETDRGIKIVLQDNGYLPGDSRKRYFKLPESYLLIPVLLMGLALSIALPYGLGLAILAVMYILHKILFSFMSECETLFGELFAHLSVRYRPTMAFFSGSWRKRKYCNREKDGKKE